MSVTDSVWSAENACGVDIAAQEPDPSKLLLSPEAGEVCTPPALHFPGLLFTPGPPSASGHRLS